MIGSLLPDLPSPDELRALRARKLRGLPRIADGLATRLRALPHLAQEAATLLACTMLLAPEDPEAEGWLRLLCRALTLQAARRIPGDGPVRMELPMLGPTSVPRTDAYGLLQAHEYSDACHAAMALDDGEALAMLAEVPLDRMETAPQQNLLMQARLLQTYARGKPTTYVDIELDALLASLEEGAEEICKSKQDQSLSNHAAFVTGAEVALAETWDRPKEEWDEALRAALGRQRLHGILEGWGTPLPLSFVALAPLAFAAKRHACGFSPTPAAPELPPGLVHRSYAGLPPRADEGADGG